MAAGGYVSSTSSPTTGASATAARSLVSDQAARSTALTARPHEPQRSAEDAPRAGRVRRIGHGRPYSRDDRFCEFAEHWLARTMQAPSLLLRTRALGLSERDRRA